MPSVRPTLIALNKKVDFYENLQGCHTIEDDLDTVIFSHVASTIPKWRTLELLRWMQNLHKLSWNHRGLRFVTMVTTPFSCDS
jgi:hypothetical protein